MIRKLILGLTFLAGLALAGLWYGQMHHLRQIASGALPGWTSWVAPEAGWRRGRMEWGATGLIPDLTLQWAARWPTPSGWRWDLRLTGAGIDLRGEMRAPFWPGSAAVAVTGGRLDLGRLVPLPGDVAGIAEVTEGNVRIAGLSGNPSVEGRIGAEVAGAAIGGAGLGAGPLTAELRPDGTWQVRTELDGGATGAEVSLDGGLPDRTAFYTVIVDDATGLPDAIRGQLAGMGQPAGDGWIVEGTIEAY